jgi:hypothetical protein
MKLALGATLVAAGVFGASLLIQFSLREYAQVTGSGGASGAPGGRPQVKESQVPFQKAGRLTLRDPFDRTRPDSHCHVHHVRLRSGRTYVIDLHSQDFDAYLRIEDAAGNGLAEDDDSGPFLDARLFFTPARSGTYALVVTTFHPDETGRYVLSVR